jgi:hypothetical protein
VSTGHDDDVSSLDEQFFGLNPAQREAVFHTDGLGWMRS